MKFKLNLARRNDPKQIIQAFRKPKPNESPSQDGGSPQIRVTNPMQIIQAFRKPKPNESPSQDGGSPQIRATKGKLQLKLPTTFIAAFQNPTKLLSQKQNVSTQPSTELSTPKRRISTRLVQAFKPSPESRRISTRLVQAFKPSPESRRMSSRLVQAFKPSPESRRISTRLVQAFKPSAESRRISSRLVQASRSRLESFSAASAAAPRGRKLSTRLVQAFGVNSNPTSPNFIRRMSQQVMKVSQHAIFQRTLPQLRGLIHWKKLPLSTPALHEEELLEEEAHLETEELMDDRLNTQTRIWIQELSEEWTTARLDEISENVSTRVVSAAIQVQRWMRNCRYREYYHTVELPRQTLTLMLSKLSEELQSNQAQLDQVRKMVHVTALSVSNQLALHAQHHSAAISIQRHVRGRAGRKTALRRRFVLERRRLFDLQRERLKSAHQALYRLTPAQIRAQEATQWRVWARSEEIHEGARPQISHFEGARPHPNAQTQSYSDPTRLVKKGVFRSMSRQRYRPSHWLDPVRIHAAPATLDDGQYRVTKMSCVEYGRFRAYQRHESPFAHSSRRLQCSLEARDELLWVGIPVTISEREASNKKRFQAPYFRMNYDWLPASHVPTLTMTAR